MAAEVVEDPRAWLAVDETAAAFLSRILATRPPIVLPPPLHRAPLRPGNVVEIAGPSNSGKSQLLLVTIGSQLRDGVLDASVYFLMIDSIGAFYLMDRGSQHVRENKGKSLQSIVETVVQDIRKVLQLQSALVMVTKSPIYGEGTTTVNDFNRYLSLVTECVPTFCIMAPHMMDSFVSLQLLQLLKLTESSSRTMTKVPYLVDLM
ncbi:hypothetical protein PR202_gb04073 [Eleusine coracana subsp. coracana]|uniref:DNA recombination and repair protein Rad51-like C-terminal domain-containing protein n=1 Tax=Eleusine coracana subsp. coracana TaxID=191504 RepID=A0AAV5E4F8_ELECO|nr:hypothetical protein PR202_gb04073 [Eleusine coracana subsp. coracana]